MMLQVDDRTTTPAHGDPLQRREPAEAVFARLWAHVQERGAQTSDRGVWLPGVCALQSTESRGLIADGLQVWFTCFGRLRFYNGDEARLRAVAAEVLG